MIATVQSHGELAHWHPHVHCLVTDGVFTKDETFIPFLEMAVEPFLKLWEKKVFDFLLRRGRVSQDIVNQMRSWRHSGFSVHKKVLIAEDDPDGLESLIQYIARCPFSLGRIIKVTPRRQGYGGQADSGQVVYKAEHDACRKFPDPASENLKGGVARNFQLFDALDFLAEVTQHIPEPRAHTIRYFGWYSNKSRGVRAKQMTTQDEVEEVVIIDCDDTPYRKFCRSRWAALIRKVYEENPLRCPKCRGEMKIIAFIERRDQPDVVEKILKHCNLWGKPESRGPPHFAEATRGRPNFELAAEEIDFILEPEYVPIDEFLANF